MDVSLDVNLHELDILQLEVALNVSSADMTALLTAATQLETLRLDGKLASTLNRNTFSALLLLPKLTDLSLDLLYTGIEIKIDHPGKCF